MKRIAVNLEQYGDFDIKVNVGVLLAPEGMSKIDVKTIINSVKDDCADKNDPEPARKLLKSYGFESLYTVDCCVGGNT